VLGRYTWVTVVLAFIHTFLFIMFLNINIYICKCIIKEMDMSLGNSTHEEIKDEMMRWMMVRFFSGMRDE
jgi:predicted DNA-binding protein (UPF0278 family)